MLHTNIRSLKRNLEKFQTHLLEELDLHFNIIGISGTRIRNELGDLDFNPMIPNYNFRYVPTPLLAEVLAYTLIKDSNIQLLKKFLRKLLRLSGLSCICQKKQI